MLIEFGMLFSPVIVLNLTFADLNYTTMATKNSMGAVKKVS